LLPLKIVFCRIALYKKIRGTIKKGTFQKARFSSPASAPMAHAAQLPTGGVNIPPERLPLAYVYTIRGNDFYELIYFFYLRG
jgi:hypothetical protein